MEISIVIISYNTEKLTRDTINSVFETKVGLDIEVIVIDNSSKDGSVEMLRELRTRNPELRTIFNKTNTGYAFANNQGIKIARGEHIFLLNSDTVVKKGALQKLLAFTNEHSDVGVVAPKLLNVDGTVQPSVLRFPTIINAIREYWFGQKGLFEKYLPPEALAKVGVPIVVDSVVGAAFLITPQALRKVGKLDEKYFFYFEDIDYCKRVWQAGLKVYYLPEAEIIHYHGASGTKVADVANQWRRLIPSSKLYHGVFKHYLLFLIMYLGQKWQKLFS